MRRCEVWLGDLGALAEGEVGRVLSMEERERAGRFRFERDRRRFVMGRGMLRALLGRRMGIGAREVAIGYGPWGKPEVKGGPGFNVSHCEELVAVAICGEEVGIDVERVRGAGAGAELDFVGMARAGLRGEDVEAVAGSDVGERAGIFFERWVAHEARVKLEGRGLGGVGTGEVWRLELGDGWKGALAMARGGGVGVEMRDFRF